MTLQCLCIINLLHTTCMHIRIQHTHTHKQVTQGRAGPVTPCTPPPPEFWDLATGGGNCAGRGADGYLSLSESISVGPFPPSAVPLSPQKPLMHPLLLTSSSFAPLTILFLLPCLSDNSKQKFNVVKIVDLKKIDTPSTVNMTVHRSSANHTRAHVWFNSVCVRWIVFKWRPITSLKVCFKAALCSYRKNF